MRIQHIRSAILTLDSGEQVFLRYFREGSFTKTYKDATGKNIYCLTSERDLSKLLLSDLDAQKHIPECVSIGSIGKRLVYRMPVYARLTSAHTEAWKQAECLQWGLERTWKMFDKYKRYTLKGQAVNRECRLFVKPWIPSELYAALRLLSETASDFGPSYVFEFPKRNLAVDNNGDLVLLDVLFDMKEI